MSPSIAFIGRALRYSPRSVDKDAAIMEAVRQALEAKGLFCLKPVSEEQLSRLPEADAYVTMGRNMETLRLLAAKEQQGKTVVNTTNSVALCNHRKLLMQQLEQSGIPVPPLMGCEGYWVKRGKGCREADNDVQYAPDFETAEALGKEMNQRGISEVEMRAHVAGFWVKFYGVCNTDFFRSYLVEDGTVRPFQRQDLHKLANTAAEQAGLEVYGGDFIVSATGPVLVDLNDWPSFSPCREEAANAIARRVIDRLTKQES